MELEMPVNRNFRFDNVRLKTVKSKSTSCNKCYFSGRNSEACRLLLCCNYERNDKTEVVFQEVKK